MGHRSIDLQFVVNRKTELLKSEEVKRWNQNSDLLSLLDKIKEIYKPGKTPHERSELVANFRALAPTVI